jgi:hypothetical protein
LSSHSVITRLEGGLGHQLFQYAAGRRLSIARGVPLLIDRSAVDAGAWPYALSPFNIVEQFSPTGARAAFETRTLLQRAIGRLGRRWLVRERSPRFESRMLSLTGRVYLDGRWQSAQYFADAEETIRREITWKVPPVSWSADLLARIESQTAVSVHVRRGNHVSDPRIAGIHGTCPVSYYRRAWRLIRERVRDPWFLVFSDDPAWARAQLTFLEPAKFVSDPGHRPDHEDLWLMTQCTHHVIANSSFSWWGAWLAETAGTVVVAPDRWFADPAHDGRDVVPPGWARVAVP